MTSDFLRWLLDLDTIPPDAQTVEFTWSHPFPAWLWALLVIGAAGLAFWSYTRQSGSVRGRTMLAAVRALTLLFVLILLAGPALQVPRKTVEEDWVVALLDRSQSMFIADALAAPGVDGRSAAGGAGDRISRDEQLKTMLLENYELFQELDLERELVWLGFHGGTFVLQNEELLQPEPPELPGSDAEAADLDAADVADAADAADAADTGGETQVAPGQPLPGVLPDLPPAEGDRTQIDAALRQAMQRAIARPLAGIVLFSDGRTQDPPSPATIRRLQSQRVPVYVVPLGAPEAIGDLAVRTVEAPRRAFVRDIVPVVVELERLGEGAASRAQVTVKLVDDATGETLDEAILPAGDAQERVTLTANPELAGEANWSIVVESADPDLVPENNIKPFLVELIDRPLRVLYIEGYPRWEYRYLKNLLVREQSIESSVMLLSADRDFAQEGNAPISRLPRSREEFERYDVMILGDVPASFFSPQQLELMREHVADRGAGLLWIGGERHVPISYAASGLSDLLPIRPPLSLTPIAQPVNLVPTELAQRLGVLQLTTGASGGGTESGGGGAAETETEAGGGGWPEALRDPSYGWSQLHYAQHIPPNQVKPTAEILASTVQSIEGAQLPLVLQMRYGAGQIVYVATDEIWRWRYGRGELLPEQFWVQMIRMLGRVSVATSGQGVILTAEPRRLAVGAPLRIDVRLLEESLIARSRRTIPAVIEDARGETLMRLELQPVEGDEGHFAATWLPRVTGQFTVRLDDLTLGAEDLRAPFEVFAPDDELRRPETDHELLADLAEATGGAVLTGDSLEELLDIRNRSVTTINPLVEPIWDTPLMFALGLILLTCEWIGRRIIRLV